MECKVFNANDVRYKCTVVIETLWNVKWTPLTHRELAYCVVIETLWNVKWTTFTNDLRSNFVVIETLWNVKYEVQKANDGWQVGCNRDIVECKVISLMTVLRLRFSL